MSSKAVKSNRFPLPEDAKKPKKRRARVSRKKSEKKLKQKQKQKQVVNVQVSAGGSGGGGGYVPIPMPSAPSIDYNALAGLLRPAAVRDMPIRGIEPAIVAELPPARAAREAAVAREEAREEALVPADPEIMRPAVIHRGELPPPPAIIGREPALADAREEVRRVIAGPLPPPPVMLPPSPLVVVSPPARHESALEKRMKELSSRIGGFLERAASPPRSEIRHGEWSLAESTSRVAPAPSLADITGPREESKALFPESGASSSVVTKKERSDKGKIRGSTKEKWMKEGEIKGRNIENLRHLGGTAFGAPLGGGAFLGGGESPSSTKIGGGTTIVESESEFSDPHRRSVVVRKGGRRAER